MALYYRIKVNWFMVFVPFRPNVWHTAPAPAPFNEVNVPSVGLWLISHVRVDLHLSLLYYSVVREVDILVVLMDGWLICDLFFSVTKCNRAETVLSVLRENKNGFDIVISDVHMPDMDGFKLLEHIGLEMDLPVFMMSTDNGKHVVMKGVTHGACDYLIKSVRFEALKNICQHVVRKRKNEWKDFEQSGSVEERD
ncbi:hypothetical protein V6N12_050723 [Hibiscus sabdariffa]|uniref:Response regulatory domain-containing protein n=1 Tax=Hibiscus sabdariffa TaxID=183260 RepID=A0ABR2GD85_9ROSI